jgi:molybdopterin-guanine dinucleotide biosynthesis protein A
MGRDKALLELGGRPPLALVAADALRAAGADPVIAVGGDLPLLSAAGLDARPDEHPDEGPLGGLLTALHVTTAEVLVVLTCDMPDVDATVVRALVDALAAAPEADLARASAGGRPQPLTAAYRRRVLDPLAAAFDGGERSVLRAAAGLVHVEVDDLPVERLADVDEPGDLHRYARRS